MVEHTKHPHHKQAAAPHLNVAEIAVAAVRQVTEKFGNTPYDFGGRFRNNHFVNDYKAAETAKDNVTIETSVVIRPGSHPIASRHGTIPRNLHDQPAPPAVEPKLGHTYHTNGIDCTGFVCLALEQAWEKVNHGKGYDVVDPSHINYTASASGSSEELYKYIIDKTGGAKRARSHLSAKDFAPGTLTVIALDTGPGRGGFDKGRELGIDHIVLTDGKYVYQSSSSQGVHKQPLDTWLQHANAKHYKCYLANPLALAKEQPLKILTVSSLGKELLADINKHGFKIHADPTANKGCLITQGKQPMVVIPERLTPQWQLFSLVNTAAAAKLVAHGMRTDSMEARAFVQAQVLHVALDMQEHGDSRLLDASRKMFPEAVKDLHGDKNPSFFTLYTHAKQQLEQQEKLQSQSPDLLGVNLAPSASHKVPQTKLNHPTDQKIAAMMGVKLPAPAFNLENGLKVNNNFSFSG